MKWTKEQLDAINVRDKNILVSAAAGSGKTSVLVERIRKMVSEEGIPIRSFLVVTFTNAAAAEMKERLRASLSKELAELDIDTKDGLNHSRYLRQQLIDLETANISTFHAFGLSVIRRFFYKLDIEPGFRTGDETETTIMMEEAMDRLLEEEFNLSEKPFIDFMDAYSGDRSSFTARVLIMEAHKKLLSIPYGYEWARDRLKEIEKIQVDFKQSEIWKIIEKSINGHLEEGEKIFQSMAHVLQDAGAINLAGKILATEVATISAAKEIMNGKESPYEKLKALNDILGVSLTSLRATKDEAEAFEEVKARVQNLKEQGKGEIEKIQKLYLPMDLEEMLDITCKTAPYLETLISLVEKFDGYYKDIKREAKVIDFNDIEHYTLEVLGDQEVSAYYKNTLKYIFIDEYQDTNLIQEAIIQRIKGEKNLFMVGDIKQSIYKFRLAEPSIFQEKYESFAPYVPGSKDESVAIDLNENHRSKSPIIDCINSIFEPLMKGYDSRVKLYNGLKYEGPLNETPGFYVVVPEEEEDGETKPGEETSELFSEEQEPMGDLEREAHFVAQLIKEYLGKPFLDSKMDPPTERPLELKDIVVLRRAVTGCQETYQEIFKEYGIDSQVEGEDGYFSTMEISGFLDILKVVDNMRRDVSLIGALHSEVFGFSAEELARIRRNHKEGSFADAFIDMALNMEEEGRVQEQDSLKEKTRLAYERIMEWREMSRALTLPVFLWKLLLDSGYYAIMGALPYGNHRQSNLRALCDMGEAYCVNSQGTIYDFLGYIEAIKRGKAKIPEFRGDSKGEDTVRIMTVHKSKGLEFPMVILSGMGRNIRTGNSGPFSLHKDIGIGIKYVDRDGFWSQKTLLQRIIDERNSADDIEEEIRILYVALTRARDRLIMVGHSKNEKFRDAADLGIISKGKYLGMVAPTWEYSVHPLSYQEHNLDLAFKKPAKVNRSTAKEEKDLLERLNYSYPYPEARSLKSKYSVTELNKENQNREETIRPKRAEKGQEKFTAGERGTFYHRILEEIPFASCKDKNKNELRKHINDITQTMIQKGILSQEAVSSIKIDNLVDFFLSDIGIRAIEADKKELLYKERPFTLKMKKGREDILVQGIIDCFFRDESTDATVLLDYKSNWIDKRKPIDEEENRIRLEYKGQLEIYKAALEEANVGPVREVYLYLLDAGHGFLV